jgi:hypothetical protein
VNFRFHRVIAYPPENIHVFVFCHHLRRPLHLISCDAANLPPITQDYYAEDNIAAQYDKNATELIAEAVRWEREADTATTPESANGIPCEGAGIAQQGSGGTSTSKTAVANYL